MLDRLLVRLTCLVRGHLWRSVPTYEYAAHHVCERPGCFAAKWRHHPRIPC